ncbi:MAG: glycosyltransferase [Proteobacteria bacterium]|nr:glycosyltransferase [Pseudomonadota bacterium]NOG59095.1 glycosyltransferase [Pseudomonadota bacterium]
MRSEPLISVVIPTYNHARFLESALQSVVDQSYAEWEVIVVNNYSEDNTIDVVNSFNDSRIKLINYKNHGIIAAGRNKGISLSKGEYIAFLDSDDIWYRDKLKECIYLLNKDYDLVCHGEYWVTNSKNRRRIIYGPEKRAAYRSLLFDGNCISTSAAVVRKKALDKVENFNESPDMVTVEDYDLWLRLSKSGAKIGFVERILGEFRIHDMNNSKAVITNMLAEQAVINQHIQLLGELNTIDTLRARRRKALVYYTAGRGFYAKHDYISALSYFQKSWLVYPFISRLYVAVVLSIFKALLKQ